MHYLSALREYVHNTLTALPNPIETALAAGVAFYAGALAVGVSPWLALYAAAAGILLGLVVVALVPEKSEGEPVFLTNGPAIFIPEKAVNPSKETAIRCVNFSVLITEAGLDHDAWWLQIRSLGGAGEATTMKFKGENAMEMAREVQSLIMRRIAHADRMGRPPALFKLSELRREAEKTVVHDAPKDSGTKDSGTDSPAAAQTPTNGTSAEKGRQPPDR